MTASGEMFRILDLHSDGESMRPTELTGRRYPAASWVRINEAVECALETGTSYEFDVEVFRGETPIWVTVHGEAVRNTDGRVVGQCGTVQDVTPRKHAELWLAESEARFRAAVQAVSGIVWTNNAIGEMAGEQPGWATLTGQAQDEYQGFGWARAVHPEDAQPTIDAWNETVRQRKPFVFEHRVRRYDGVWRRRTGSIS